MIDLTGSVEERVRRSGVNSGLCLIRSLHSTTAIVINEHEGGLLADMMRKVRQDFPKGAGWLHDQVDDNAHAHLASIFIGPSQTLAVKNGELLRGTWQHLFLLELDGPRRRTVVVEVLGE